MRRGRGALIAFFMLHVLTGCAAENAPSATPTGTPPSNGPVANAGLDQGNIAPLTVVTLDGSRSISPSGRPLTYTWTFSSIPAGSPAVLTNPGTVSPTFTVDRAGNYIAQLIVNDGIVDSAPAQVTISTNQVAPVADAGPNQAVIRNALVTLDGSRSSDGNGDPLTYSWSLTTRPTGSAVALANPTTIHPTFIVDQLGNYTAQLIVNDGHVNSRAAEVTISTSNVAPVANAGPNQTVGPGTPVTLNGSGSTDANGDPLTYSWSLLSIPTGSAAVLANPTSAHPTFTADRAGDYIAQLIVNDRIVDSAPATVRISTSNVAPVANAGPNQTFLPGTPVTLDGSHSTDANGDPLTYSWSLLSKPANSTSVLTNPGTVHPTLTLDRQAGDYIVQLIVNDGTVNSAPVTVTITTSNVAPVANAGPDQAVAGGTPVTLNGSGSTDANGDPLTYSWSLTTRPAGSAAVLANPTSAHPTFTADRAGDYIAQLIVNDGALNSAPDTVTISTSNVAPVANAGPNQTVGPGTPVTLDGSHSIDANGDPLTYSWSLTTRPAGSAAVLANPTSAHPTFTADRAGDYIAQLIVNDGALNSAPAMVTISTSNVAPVANAGPNQTVAAGTQVTLNGSGSIDANGDPLTYSWSLTTTPTGSVAALADPATVSPTFTADRAGDYIAQLIVNDGTVNSAPATVTIIAQ